MRDVGAAALWPRSDQLWTADLVSGKLTTAALESGATTARPIAGPLRQVSRVYQLRLIELPGTDLLLISTGFGLLLYDPESGMSNTVAWRQPAP